MIRAERIEVGEEPIDLAEGSQLSGVSIQFIRNASKRGVLLLGGDADGAHGIPIGPGESGPEGISLGSTDHLHVRAEKGSVEADVVLSWA